MVIPANAIQTASGAPYTGTVTVGASYYNPDTIEGVQAFAAPYEGTDAGTSSPLITVGVIEVKLTDAAGEPLQLKAGFPATLTYPATASAARASSIPLWYYDEATRVWVREGSASQQANGSYVASVTHFTMWNMDFKGVTATIKGCFRDNLGNVVKSAGTVGLRGQGWGNTRTGVTEDGNFTLINVPANLALDFYSTAVPGAFAPVAIALLAPAEIRQLPCVVVTNPPATGKLPIPLPTTIFTPPAATQVVAPVLTPVVVGTPVTPVTPVVTPVVTPTPAAYAGNYAGSFSGAEIGTFNVTVSSAGVMSGRTVSTTYNGMISSVTGTVGSDGAVALTATSGTAGAATFTGTISATGAVSGTWRYTTGLTGGGTFAGQRV